METAVKERILSDVITDARKKYPDIKKWGYSANQKIIVYFSNADKLPRYYSNIYEAIDSIVHRYNLLNKYRFIYTKYNARLQKSDEQTHAKQKNVQEVVIENIVYACDELLLQDKDELNSAIKQNIYKAIRKAHLKTSSEITSESFYIVRAELIRHYEELLLLIEHKRKKNYIEKIINFFQKITFLDFNDMS